MEREIAISLKDVSFYYGTSKNQNIAIENINFNIFKGEFACIIGHNGSGKSTLAKLFNGLILPKSGDVEIFGENTKNIKNIYKIRSNVGMIFQNPDNQLVASIIEDDIAFGPENLGVPREEIIERVEWALSSVGMLEYRKRTPFKLSGGQKQRIAIAGVLAMKPSILVLDESTAMLDPRGRKEVLEVVKKLNKEGITVVLITHYMDETLDADHLIVMNRGRIFKEGTPSEVFKDYKKLEEINLTFPIISEINNRLIDDGLKLDNKLKTREEFVEEICRLL